MQPQERASKKQQELLSFVDGFIKGNGYGPSYREIMRALGYKSVSTVAIHVENLITKGYLARRDKSARSLEVVSLQSPTKPNTQPKVSDELAQRINSRTFSQEEKQTISAALTLLGYDELAGELQGYSDASSK